MIITNVRVRKCKSQYSTLFNVKQHQERGREEREVAVLLMCMYIDKMKTRDWEQ